MWWIYIDKACIKGINISFSAQQLYCAWKLFWNDYCTQQCEQWFSRNLSCMFSHWINTELLLVKICHVVHLIAHSIASKCKIFLPISKFALCFVFAIQPTGIRNYWRKLSGGERFLSEKTVLIWKAQKFFKDIADGQASRWHEMAL